MRTLSRYLDDPFECCKEIAFEKTKERKKERQTDRQTDRKKESREEERKGQHLHFMPFPLEFRTIPC